MSGIHDELIATNLQATLIPHPFITQVVYQPCLGSTNDLAKELANQGVPEGLLVIADEQRGGRGRMGRQWWAPPGSALLTSLLFRPTLVADPVNQSRHEQVGAVDLQSAQQLVMLCALAAADAITNITALPVDLKWPNDLTIHDRKLAGLLGESIFSGDRLEAVIVGVGINVNTDFSKAPDFITPATSLRIELGRPVDRLPLLVSYLDGVAQRNEQLRAGGSPYAEWASRLTTVGQYVTAYLNDRTAAVVDTPRDASPRYLSGVAEGVDIDGALLLRTSEGTLYRLLAADVSLRDSASPQRALDPQQRGTDLKPSI
jgi:BirA family biotin operon repressor/biotin-[acetyl-CoA-carboxylase] ligase